jgi:hypothetical protein
VSTTVARWQREFLENEAPVSGRDVVLAAYEEGDCANVEPGAVLGVVEVDLPVFEKRTEWYREVMLPRGLRSRCP